MKALFFLALASPLLSGCVFVGTIQPLVPDSAAVSEPRLLGSWETTDDRARTERAAVAANGPRGYTITYVDQNRDTSVFAARLGQIGGRLILDVSPGGEAKRLVDRWGNFLLPTHLAIVLEFAGAEVRAAGFNGDSLRASLAAGHPRLAYVRLANGDIVLTGTSAELDAGLREYMARPGAIEAYGVWRRPAAPGP